MLEAINKNKNIKLIIDEDDNVGFYLLVYVVPSNKCIADYLCDNLEAAFFEAKERYGVTSDEFYEQR